MDCKEIIRQGFGLAVDDIRLIESHFGTELYDAHTDSGRMFVKKAPLRMKGMKNEGRITELVRAHGINAPLFIRNKDGGYCVETQEDIFTVQQFMPGRTLRVNTAPPWLVERQAQLLGQIQAALSGYEGLEQRFGANFFAKTTVEKRLERYREALAGAKADEANAWETQIAHLERLMAFDIDPAHLTYANSHGDFYISQLLVDGEDVAVIDWSSACRLPVCIEIMISYVFSSPGCAGGEIDAKGLKDYVNTFSKYASITDYDIAMLPYVFYYWQTLCNFWPNEPIPESYGDIAAAIEACLAWLADNVDTLSAQLRQL